LSARWVEQAALRYTPSGVPALDLVLEHIGQSIEAGAPRRIELRVRAVVLGELARQLSQPSAEVEGLFTGFLAPSRNGKGVVFHITAFDPTSV
jgi:primosomal replication protein N